MAWVPKVWSQAASAASTDPSPASRTSLGLSSDTRVLHSEVFTGREVSQEKGGQRRCEVEAEEGWTEKRRTFKDEGLKMEPFNGRCQKCYLEMEKVFSRADK